MYPCIPIGIILRLWLDETVVAIHNLTIPYYHNAHGANAGSLLVAVSKSIAAKFFMSAKLLILDVLSKFLIFIYPYWYALFLGNFYHVLGFMKI